MDCIKDAMKDAMFLKEHTVTCNAQINPSVFPFVTMMTVDEKEGNLHPYVAPINHNELNNTKAKEIMYSILDYCINDGTQSSNLGNDAVVLVGCQNNVRLYPLFQIFCRIIYTNTLFAFTQSKSVSPFSWLLFIGDRLLLLLSSFP